MVLRHWWSVPFCFYAKFSSCPIKAQEDIEKFHLYHEQGEAGRIGALPLCDAVLPV